MAKRIFVKLQTPIIELPVTAIDASWEEQTIIVGFKRYSLTELQVKIDAYNAATQATTETDSYLVKEISYIKNGILEAYEVDKAGEIIPDSPVETVIVEDTRTVVPNEFFQDSASCLAVLLEKYVASAPWKNSLYKALLNALLNTTYSEDKVKN